MLMSLSVCSFYGITNIQTYVYYDRCRDELLLRWLVRFFGYTRPSMCLNATAGILSMVRVQFPSFGRVAIHIVIARTLDTLHMGLMIHTIYFYAVSNFANPAVIEKVTW